MRTLFKVVIFLCGFSLVIPIGSLAIQPDAEFLVREKQFGKQWATEDKQVHEKLETLEKKFGKKPNIIFILAMTPIEQGFDEAVWSEGNLV